MASEATVTAILPAAIKTAAPVLYDQLSQNEEKIEKLNEQMNELNEKYLAQQQENGSLLDKIQTQSTQNENLESENLKLSQLKDQNF